MSVRSLVGSDRRLGTIAFALVGVFLVLVVTGALRGLVTDDGSRIVRASFADTRQLTKGSPVRIDGVKVGEVEDLRLAPGARASTVELRLLDHAGPLYRDAGARIRFRTLLGGTFAVDLERGTKNAGELGDAEIPVSRTGDQVELDEITSVLQGKALTGFKTLPDEAARALRDADVPAAALRALSRHAPSLEHGLAAVRGQQPDADVERLVTATAETVAALDRPGRRLRESVSGTAAFVQTTAARRAELRDSLAQAPGLLRRTDLTLTRLRGTLSITDPLLRRVRGAADEVAPTVSRLRGVVVPADRLLDDAAPLLERLRPAVRSLARASRQGVPLLAGLAPSLERLDETILPQTREDQPDTGRSTSELIGPAAAALAAIGSYVDDAGRVVRFPATSGNNFLYSPCQLYVNDPSQDKAVACEALEAAARAFLSRQEGKR